MIRYDLQCDQDHAFDGWFANSAAFDRQAAAGLIACPQCGSEAVRKSIMAPNVSSRTRMKGGQDVAVPAEVPPSASASVTNDPSAVSAEKVVAFLRAVRKAVEANADHVGPKFAEEARKIHYGETEERAIYGEATREEAQDLAEEGIAFHPLPILPEDRN